jgi:hypothetical protein
MHEALNCRLIDLRRLLRATDCSGQLEEQL